jgi:hypothetical protein
MLEREIWYPERMTKRMLSLLKPLMCRIERKSLGEVTAKPPKEANVATYSTSFSSSGTTSNGKQ